MSTALPGAGLLLALGMVWHAGIVIADARTVARRYPGGRVYRVGHGWTSSAAFAAYRRLAYAMLAAGAALAAACVGARLAPGRGTATALGGCAAAVLVLIFANRRYGGVRYAGTCLALLAGCLTVAGAALAVGGQAWTAAAGALASFFAAQLYLVAGLRKVRSRHFMNGGVLIDNLAYNAAQAAAGNHDFLPWPRQAALSELLTRPAPRAVCRAVSVATALGELLLGLAVLGLLPAPATLALAVLLHAGFLLISPLRIVPFAVAATGLVLLATSHPMLLSALL
ncbi:hypothetical protein [Streptomyces sp. UNOB3_S3]|uniref:hypothetical protein n=1 Tax=Streptomyces sp. UNOB3_S3 TaxID=2871682 RepID=UPI001E4C4EB3|nr:hypothetical protein [Streptomyces sp. UNOB3_S3]MCC3776055.1 hypothetical protein [Streptomyces sp. UNOB3_S3]